MDAAREKLIDRVRKLLRLSKSNNQHEAVRAREQAAAIMRKHGITREDVEELITQAVDKQRDSYREFLAVLTSKFFGCVMVGKKDAIGFRGSPKSVKMAQTFYADVMVEAEEALNPPVAPGLKDVAIDLWKFCWWNAFMKVVYERFGRPTGNPKATLTPSERQQQKGELPPPEDNPVEDARESADELRNVIDIHWLMHEAKRGGTAAGHRIKFPLPTEDKPQPIGLPDLYSVQSGVSDPLDTTAARARYLEVDDTKETP